MTLIFSTILTIIIISLIPARSFAQTACTSQDLRNPVLGPPPDQGISGWCFAHTTSDLLSYELNRKISASDIAITYLASNKGIGQELTRWLQKSPDDEGGTEMGALKASRRKGLCLEDRMESTPQAFEEYLLLRHRDSTTSPFAQRYIQKCVDPRGPCELESDLFSGSNFCDILKVSAQVGALRNIDFEQAQDKACGRRIQVPSNIKFRKVSRGQGSLTSKIRQVLNQGKPVAIDYLNIITGDGKTRHSSTIVGSRQKSGKCEYLVRLSSGASCRKIPPRFECDPRDPGNAWIAEDELEPSLRNIVFVP